MHESPRDFPVEAPLPPELCPYLVLETESARAPAGSQFQGWWVFAWQSRLPVLQIEKGRSHPVGRCMTLIGDGQTTAVLPALQGARLFITTERHWLSEAARLRIPTIWVADGRPDCNALSGGEELAPGTGLPPESALFEPGLFQAVFSHTAYRRELPLRRLFEAAQKLAPGIMHEGLSESSACRERMLPHLRGRIADIGHGGCKILPQAVGVDFFQYDESDWIGDARDLWIFEDQEFDTVYSSHCLEDLWHPYQALEEWTRILRVGGRICLYLPLKDHYPNVGTPGANPGHKDDYIPEDVAGFLQDLGHMDLLVSERRESEDSFEVIAEKKQGRSFFLQSESRDAPLVSVLIGGAVTGDSREDNRSLLACIESAHASLEGVLHEILVLDRSAAEGDARAGLRDLAARHAEIHILEDRSPATWPRRLMRLHRMARGKWLCVLDGQSLVLGKALRQLVEHAASENAVAALPEVLDDKAQLQDPEYPPCLLIRADLGLLQDTEDTAFLTGLYLRHCIDQCEKRGHRVCRVEGAHIAHEGWASQNLSTLKLSSLSFDRSLRGRDQRTPYQAEQILLTIFRTLGDCILATPIIEQLKARDPECKITVLTEQRYAWIFENHPQVACLVTVPDLGEKEFTIHEDAALLHYLSSLEAPTFDRLLFLSDRLDQVTYHQSGSSLQSMYAVLAGVPQAAELRPRVFLAESTLQEARRILNSHGIFGDYAILHRQAGWSNKDISKELAAELALKIQQEHGLPVIQIGGSGESFDPRVVIDLCGQLKAPLSAALIQLAALHVGPDSGPLHLASCYDVPSLGLYAGSGTRVAPPLAWQSVAIQSPSSCGVSCGTSHCTQRRPCAKDLEIGIIEGPLQDLLAGNSTRMEFCGSEPALYRQSPAGDQWVHVEALPAEARNSKISIRTSCVDGPVLASRTRPLDHQLLVIPSANQRKCVWRDELQRLLSSPQTVRIASTSESLQMTLDSIPAWSAIETTRALAARARKKGDVETTIHWLIKALDLSAKVVTGISSRKRPAFRLVADELYFDLCSAMHHVEDHLPPLLELMKRYEDSFGEKAPLLATLTLLTAEGSCPIRDAERRVLDQYVHDALSEQDAITDDLLLLFAMALVRIGQEQESVSLIENRLLTIPEDRCAQRAALAARLGFLLAKKPETLPRARDYLIEAQQGFDNETQRKHIEGLLVRIEAHLGSQSPTPVPNPNILLPHAAATRSRSYRSGKLKVRDFPNIEVLAAELGFEHPGRLLEPDLDVVESDCDLDERKRRDAEVLCWMAANLRGDILDLGTSHGRSAFKFATNQRKGEKVYTVNALPEQIQAGEKHITHKLDAATIGSYYRARGIRNVEQIYANTLDWIPPEGIADLACVFVDANHDGAAVYSDSMKSWDLLRVGGYLLWHDFCPAMRTRHPWIDSVMQGIEAFLHAQQIDREILHLDGSWIGLVCKTAVAPGAAHSSHPTAIIRSSIASR